MKKIFKRIIACVLFFALFIGCGCLFDFILVDDSSYGARLSFHEMWQQDQIDTLLVGSSHIGNQIDPHILNARLEINSFNAGSTGQQLDGSLAIIKEAIKKYDIQHIYLELFYMIANDPAVENRSEADLGKGYQVARYLPFSFDKLAYLLQMSDKEYWIGNLISARRGASNFYDSDKVKNILEFKLSEGYRTYDPSVWEGGDIIPYAGLGYFPIHHQIENWNYFVNLDGWDITLEKMSPDWEKDLLEIVKLCEENDIELTIFSAPIPPFSLLAFERNYDDYIDYVNRLLEGTGVKYYDFNLLKEEYFPNVSEVFSDMSHINSESSEIVTNYLADLASGERTTEELFYNSYAQRVENMEPTVFGVVHTENKEGIPENTYRCKIVSSREDMEYEISAAGANGEAYFNRGFSDDLFFDLPIDQAGGGQITIRYRIKDDPETVYETAVTT